MLGSNFLFFIVFSFLAKVLSTVSTYNDASSFLNAKEFVKAAKLDLDNSLIGFGECTWDPDYIWNTNEVIVFNEAGDVVAHSDATSNTLACQFVGKNYNNLKDLGTDDWDSISNLLVDDSFIKLPTFALASDKSAPVIAYVMKENIYWIVSVFYDEVHPLEEGCSSLYHVFCDFKFANGFLGHAASDFLNASTQTELDVIFNEWTNNDGLRDFEMVGVDDEGNVVIESATPASIGTNIAISTLFHEFRNSVLLDQHWVKFNDLLANIVIRKIGSIMALELLGKTYYFAVLFNNDDMDVYSECPSYSNLCGVSNSVAMFGSALSHILLHPLDSLVISPINSDSYVLIVDPSSNMIEYSSQNQNTDGVDWAGKTINKLFEEWSVSAADKGPLLTELGSKSHYLEERHIPTKWTNFQRDGSVVDCVASVLRVRSVHDSPNRDLVLLSFIIIERDFVDDYCSDSSDSVCALVSMRHIIGYAISIVRLSNSVDSLLEVVKPGSSDPNHSLLKTNTGSFPIWIMDANKKIIGHASDNALVGIDLSNSLGADFNRIEWTGFVWFKITDFSDSDYELAGIAIKILVDGTPIYICSTTRYHFRRLFFPCSSSGSIKSCGILNAESVLGHVALQIQLTETNEERDEIYQKISTSPSDLLPETQLMHTKLLIVSMNGILIATHNESDIGKSWSQIRYDGAQLHKRFVEASLAGGDWVSFMELNKDSLFVPTLGYVMPVMTTEGMTLYAIAYFDTIDGHFNHDAPDQFDMNVAANAQSITGRLMISILSTSTLETLTDLFTCLNVEKEDTTVGHGTGESRMQMRTCVVVPFDYPIMILDLTDDKVVVSNEEEHVGQPINNVITFEYGYRPIQIVKVKIDETWTDLGSIIAVTNRFQHQYLILAGFDPMYPSPHAYCSSFYRSVCARENNELSIARIFKAMYTAKSQETFVSDGQTAIDNGDEFAMIVNENLEVIAISESHKFLIGNPLSDLFNGVYRTMKTDDIIPELTELEKEYKASWAKETDNESFTVDRLDIYQARAKAEGAFWIKMPFVTSELESTGEALLVNSLWATSMTTNPYTGERMFVAAILMDGSYTYTTPCKQGPYPCSIHNTRVLLGNAILEVLSQDTDEEALETFATFSNSTNTQWRVDDEYIFAISESGLVYSEEESYLTNISLSEMWARKSKASTLSQHSQMIEAAYISGGGWTRSTDIDSSSGLPITTMVYVTNIVKQHLDAYIGVEYSMKADDTQSIPTDSDLLSFEAIQTLPNILGNIAHEMLPITSEDDMNAFFELVRAGDYDGDSDRDSMVPLITDMFGYVKVFRKFEDLEGDLIDDYLSEASVDIIDQHRDLAIVPLQKVAGIFLSTKFRNTDTIEFRMQVTTSIGVYFITVGHENLMPTYDSNCDLHYMSACTRLAIEDVMLHHLMHVLIDYEMSYFSENDTESAQLINSFSFGDDESNTILEHRKANLIGSSLKDLVPELLQIILEISDLMGVNYWREYNIPFLESASQEFLDFFDGLTPPIILQAVRVMVHEKSIIIVNMISSRPPVTSFPCVSTYAGKCSMVNSEAVVTNVVTDILIATTKTEMQSVFDSLEGLVPKYFVSDFYAFIYLEAGLCVGHTNADFVGMTMEQIFETLDVMVDLEHPLQLFNVASDRPRGDWGTFMWAGKTETVPFQKIAFIGRKIVKFGLSFFVGSGYAADGIPARTLFHSNISPPLIQNMRRVTGLASTQLLATSDSSEIEDVLNRINLDQMSTSSGQSPVVFDTSSSSFLLTAGGSEYADLRLTKLSDFLNSQVSEIAQTRLSETMSSSHLGFVLIPWKMDAVMLGYFAFVHRLNSTLLVGTLHSLELPNIDSLKHLECTTTEPDVCAFPVLESIDGLLAACALSSPSVDEIPSFFEEHLMQLGEIGFGGFALRLNDMKVLATTALFSEVSSSQHSIDLLAEFGGEVDEEYGFYGKDIDYKTILLRANSTGKVPRRYDLDHTVEVTKNRLYGVTVAIPSVKLYDGSENLDYSPYTKIGGDSISLLWERGEGEGIAQLVANVFAQRYDDGSFVVFGSGFFNNDDWKGPSEAYDPLGKGLCSSLYNSACSAKVAQGMVSTTISRIFEASTWSSVENLVRTLPAFQVQTGAQQYGVAVIEDTGYVHGNTNDPTWAGKSLSQLMLSLGILTDSAVLLRKMKQGASEGGSFISYSWEQESTVNSYISGVSTLGHTVYVMSSYADTVAPNVCGDCPSHSECDTRGLYCECDDFYTLSGANCVSIFSIVEPYQPLADSVLVVATLALTICLFSSMAFCIFRNRMIMLHKQRYFQGIAIGLSLVFLACMMLTISPEEYSWVCIARPSSMFVGCVLLFSLIFTRIHQISKRFDGLGYIASHRFTLGEYGLVRFSAAIILPLLVCFIACMILKPPEYVLHYNADKLDDTKTNNEAYHICDLDNRYVAFATTFVDLLLLWGLWQALRTRALPRAGEESRVLVASIAFCLPLSSAMGFMEILFVSFPDILMLVQGFGTIICGITLYVSIFGGTMSAIFHRMDDMLYEVSDDGFQDLMARHNKHKRYDTDDQQDNDSDILPIDSGIGGTRTSTSNNINEFNIIDEAAMYRSRRRSSAGETTLRVMNSTSTPPTLEDVVGVDNLHTNEHVLLHSAELLPRVPSSLSAVLEAQRTATNTEDRLSDDSDDLPLPKEVDDWFATKSEHNNAF